MGDFLKGILRDENDTWSSSRALNVLAALIGMFVIVWLTVLGKITEGYFTIYIAAYVGNYLVSKQLSKPVATTTNIITSTAQPASLTTESTTVTEAKP